MIFRMKFTIPQNHRRDHHFVIVVYHSLNSDCADVSDQMHRQQFVLCPLFLLYRMGIPKKDRRKTRIYVF